LQFVVLIGLYNGLIKVVHNHEAIVSFAYPALQHLGWMQQLSHNIHLFDNTLFGVVDLTRTAVGKSGIYWPAMVLVIGSAIMQYYQSKQLMPTDKNARSLRQILSAAGNGKQADQSEVNAAVGRSTRWLLPVFIFIVTINLPAALGLYWLVGGIVAFIQQDRVLRQDETEMEAMADEPSKDVANIPEAELVTPPKTKNKKQNRRRKKR
jgi:YidC/Oxa1 family membrane protein insertase